MRGNKNREDARDDAPALYLNIFEKKKVTRSFRIYLLLLRFNHTNMFIHCSVGEIPYEALETPHLVQCKYVTSDTSEITFGA